MEEAQKNLIFGNLKEAIEAFTKLIDAQPTRAVPYLYRAIAYTQLANYDLAIKDLEKSNQIYPTNFQTHLRLGIALFFKQQFPQSLAAFKAAEPLATKEHEKTEVAAWIQKCNREIGNASASALNSFGLLPAKGAAEDVKMAVRESGDEGMGKKLEYDWYQSSTHVYVTLKIHGLTKDKFKALFSAQEFSVEADLDEGKSYEYAYGLNAEIVPESCSFTVAESKVELKLKKKIDGVQWAALERTGTRSTDRPAYPTSAKKKIDWDKLNREIVRETAKEKPEGEEALAGLFKGIYE